MQGELATMQLMAIQAPGLDEACIPEAEQSALGTCTCTGSSYPATVNLMGRTRGGHGEGGRLPSPSSGVVQQFLECRWMLPGHLSE